MTICCRHPVWKQIMSGEMTFGDRINYITLKHLKESSEHLGGVEEGSTAHLIHKSGFCVSTLRLIEDCWHLTEKPGKPPRGQEFCCCIFFTSLLLSFRATFEKQSPSVFLSLVVCSSLQKTNLLCHIAWQEITISQRCSTSQGNTVSINVFKYQKSYIRVDIQ